MRDGHQGSAGEEQDPWAVGEASLQAGASPGIPPINMCSKLCPVLPQKGMPSEGAQRGTQAPRKVYFWRQWAEMEP